MCNIYNITNIYYRYYIIYMYIYIYIFIYFGMNCLRHHIPFILTTCTLREHIVSHGQTITAETHEQAISNCLTTALKCTLAASCQRGSHRNG